MKQTLSRESREFDCYNLKVVTEDILLLSMTFTGMFVNITVLLQFFSLPCKSPFMYFIFVTKNYEIHYDFSRRCLFDYIELMVLSIVHDK